MPPPFEGGRRLLAPRSEHASSGPRLRAADRLQWTHAGTRGAVIARRPYTAPTPRSTEDTTKEAALELFGTIKQVFPSTTFAVELENGQTILAHIAGRLRRHRIKILPGDRVDLEISPYDLTKGRIVYRYRAGEPRRS